MKIVVIFLVAIISATGAWSQSSVSIPLTDGTITEGEYTILQVKNEIFVGAWLSADKTRLNLSVSAATSGWIAIGVGASKMDGAFMILGYVASGKPFITYEQGAGHAHSTIAATGVTAEISESDGKTVLEVSMPAASYVSNNTLQVITAFGTKDDAKSRHSKRASYDFKF
jgi:hypothetical protein